MRPSTLTFGLWCLNTYALDGGWFNQQLLIEDQTTTVTLTSTIMSTVTAVNPSKAPSPGKSQQPKTVTYAELVTRHLMPDVFQSDPPLQAQQPRETFTEVTLAAAETSPAKATVALVVLLDAVEP
ncbi:hypothetical protein CBER1_10554 [Cercospora berteroae]|uniref:Uncharacterized protein n=1 Tax=Cercospora berteroae TaxID=357750 RepID=A0A2S6CJ22_9PEZI|nr:hypothetical protein CBER1_10554 [Cercospora berteroae]